MEKLLQPPYLWIILGTMLILDVFFTIKAEKIQRPNLIIRSLFTVVLIVLCILAFR